MSVPISDCGEASRLISATSKASLRDAITLDLNNMIAGLDKYNMQELVLLYSAIASISHKKFLPSPNGDSPEELRKEEIRRLYIGMYVEDMCDFLRREKE